MVKTIKNCKAEFIKYKQKVLWEDINVGDIYHIPPILSLERRNIVIIRKGENEATYREYGTKEERTFHRNSVLSRFLTKIRRF